MARSTLPRHARTGLLAVGFRKDGRPIWPILGGSEPSGEPAPNGDPAPADPPAPADTGFPPNTPVAEMNPAQQAAYWKHQARKHEDRVKAFGGLTPEDLADLRERAERADALEEDLISDQDKALREAASNSRLIAEAEFMPRLVAAEFRVAAAGRIEPDKLATILEPLDLSKFLTDDGEIDTDKVTAFVDGVAPAKGTERQGPSSGGAGRRGNYTTGSSSVASGREMFAARHKTHSS